MSQVTIRIRDNGPLLIEGALVIVDGENNAVPLSPDKPSIALCRCGASNKKPFCDGSHKTCGFQSVVRTPSANS